MTRAQTAGPYRASRSLLAVAAAASMLVVPSMVGVSQLKADVIDDLLSATHTAKWWFQNPYSNNGLNPIVGIDGNGKDEYALVWKNGDVARYHEGDMGTDHFATFGATSNATAISYVTPGAGITGFLAVADLFGFGTHDASGVLLDGYNVTSTGIQDLDINLGKVWVATDTNFGWRQSDGTIHEMLSGGVDAVVTFDFIDPYNDRILVSNFAGNFVKTLASDLSFLPGSIETDFLSYTGYAMTDNDFLLVINDYVFCYDSPFHGYIVPEPASAVLFGCSVLVVAARGRRSR